MRLHLLVLALVIALPAPARAQFSDKGDNVEVKKGTTLCSNLAMKQMMRSALDQKGIFWRVTSAMRVNGTQTIAALVHETVYDRKSGDTTIMERRYDEDYATFFKRDPEHQGMLVMISPQDGRVQAIVEVCRKR